MSISPITRCLNSAWRVCVNADPWTKTAAVAGAGFLALRYCWVKSQPVPPPPQQPAPDPPEQESPSPTGRLAQHYLGISDLNEEGAENAIFKAIAGEEGAEIPEAAARFKTPLNAQLSLAEAFLGLDICSLEQTRQIHDIVRKLWNDRQTKPEDEILPLEFQEGCSAEDLETAKFVVRETIVQVRSLPPPKSNTPLANLLSAHLEGEIPPLSETDLAERIAMGHIEGESSDQTRALRLALLCELFKQEEIPLSKLKIYELAMQEIEAKDATDFQPKGFTCEPKFIAFHVDRLKDQAADRLGKTPLLDDTKVTPTRYIDPSVRKEGEATRQAKVKLNEKLATVQKKLGEADDNGDCLFHAIGQQVGKTVKELRLLVSDEVNAHPEKYQRFFVSDVTKKLDTQAFEEYKEKIALTNEEASPPMWGRSELDGAILAEKLNVRLKIYEVHPEETLQKISYTKPYIGKTFNRQAQKRVEIACFSDHFMPILPLSE